MRVSRTDVIFLLVVLFAAVNTYWEVRTRGWGYAGKNWLVALVAACVISLFVLTLDWWV